MESLPLLHEAWPLWPLFPLWILFWIVVVATVLRVAGPRWWPGCGRSVRGGATSILAERFARGEIDATEYRARRDELRQ